MKNQQMMVMRAAARSGGDHGSGKYLYRDDAGGIVGGEEYLCAHQKISAFYYERARGLLLEFLEWEADQKPKSF